MKALPSNIDKYRKSGCMPVSASCVTWDGPNIPCIDLCNGDTIDVVIYEMAKILCDITENVLDVSSLDFECLIEGSQCPPDTLLETLQLIISQICLPPVVPPTPPTPLIIAQLPLCLQYVDPETGDTVTALPIVEYVEYLAQTICDIIIRIGSIESVLNSINTQLQIIQNIIDNGGGGSSVPPVINVTTQCLSGTAPGQTLAIETAFSNMEQALCSYLAILGTLTQWQEMFNTICIDEATPLPCGDGTYGDIAGWITNPSTAAQSMTNLWLVVCQLNDCMSTTPAIPCITIPPVSVAITSTSTTGGTITWVAPVTTGSQAPVGYKIEVFYIGGGVPLITTIVGPTPLSYTIVSPGLDAGEEYVINVSALYDCGTSSPVETTGVLVDLPYVGKLFYRSTSVVGKPQNCTNPIGPVVTPFNPTQTTLRVDLLDGSLAPLINTGTAIEVTIRIEYVACSSDPVVETDLVITIPNGQSFGTTMFFSSGLIYCPGEGCINATRSVLCLVSAELAGGAPLPSTIGLDTTLTSLGTC